MTRTGGGASPDVCPLATPLSLRRVEYKEEKNGEVGKGIGHLRGSEDDNHPQFDTLKVGDPG